MRPDDRRRRLDVQRLETRLPLAGDVVASLAAGVLTLHGDAAANFVEISTTAAGDVRVVALPRLGGGDTRLLVDGAPVAEHDFRSVTALRVRLGAGDDSCRLSGREPFSLDTVDIGTGSGADICRLDLGATITGAVTVATGADADVVDLGATILGDLRLTTGDGADVVAAEGLSVGGGVVLDLGAGDDSVSVVNEATFQRDVRILAGDGADDVALLGGIDVAANLRIATGAGPDEVGLTGLDVRGDVALATGSGDDRVSVTSLTSGAALRVDAGGGHDAIDLAGGVEITGDLTLVAGGGTDVLTTTGLVRVHGSASANLGAGTGETLTVRQADDSPDGRTLDVDGDVTIVKPAGTATITLSGSGPNGRPQVGRDLVISATGGATTVGVVGVGTGRDLRITTGAGGDLVTIGQLTIGRRLVVATGAGSATVEVGQVSTGEDARISGGDGVDAVRWRDGSVQRQLFALLGRGDDTLDLRRVVPGSTDLRGGPGTDALVTDLLRNLVPPTFTGFESVAVG